jgi:hypothetical protein
MYVHSYCRRGIEWLDRGNNRRRRRAAEEVDRLGLGIKEAAAEQTD